MSRRNPIGTFWPSPHQEMLLEVALGEPDDAIAAWTSLRPQFDLDELERGSFALLPLIYRNLTTAGFDDSVLPRLKGTYRKAWVRNRLLLERTREAAEALRARDVPALFVEGVMLAERFYPELGLRPASSVDLLVEAGSAREAVEGLEGVGWLRPTREHTDPRSARYLSDEAGNTLALRTRLAADFDDAAQQMLWEAAERHVVAAVELLVPTPTDTLLALCAANARASGSRNTQWIADAKMVLAGDLEWERLITVALESGQSLRLKEACAYLASLPGPQPPQPVSVALAETKPPMREQLAYRVAAGGGAWRVPFAAGRRALRHARARVRHAA